MPRRRIRPKMDPRNPKGLSDHDDELEAAFHDYLVARFGSEFNDYATADDVSAAFEDFQEWASDRDCEEI